jgi:hypothetical protein
VASGISTGGIGARDEVGLVDRGRELFGPGVDGGWQLREVESRAHRAFLQVVLHRALFRTEAVEHGTVMWRRHWRPRLQSRGGTARVSSVFGSPDVDAPKCHVSVALQNRS